MQKHRLAIEIEQQWQCGPAREASEAGIDDRHLVIEEYAGCIENRVQRRRTLRQQHDGIIAGKMVFIGTINVGTNVPWPTL